MAADLTLKILRQIRDEVRGTNKRIDQTNARLDQTNERLARLEPLLPWAERVEGALMELTVQQRFLNRYVKGLSERDRRIEAELADVRGRVDALERRSP